jgi:hypothetical protein
MTFSRVWLLLLAASGWITVLVADTAPGAPLRVVTTIVFLLVCPGAAMIVLIRPLLGRRDHTGDAMESAALTLAISIGLGILVSEAYFLTGTFTMSRAMITLAGITSAAALGALVTTRRLRRAPVPRREVSRRRESQDW